MSSVGSSRVRIISERSDDVSMQPSPAPQLPVSQVDTPASTTSSASFYQAMTGTMTAIAMVISVRLTLLLSILGGFALAWQAAANPDVIKLAMTGVYDGLVVIPMIYLALMK